MSCCGSHFNPRTPCGVRLSQRIRTGNTADFNPRTPCGVRQYITIGIPDIIAFQSTHPLRGATSLSWVYFSSSSFQSTHPLRGATTDGGIETIDFIISIHAPLAGCDFRTAHRSPYRHDFNPRTPCGVRPPPTRAPFLPTKFQSTHPLRGATTRGSAVLPPAEISIHAPLAGCDIELSATRGVKNGFQSTHPLRGATRRCNTFHSSR